VSSYDADDKRITETVESYKKTGSQNATADALGIARSTVRHRLTKATRMGLLEPTVRPAPPGEHIKGTSTLYTGDGQIKQQWVKTAADTSAEDMRIAIEDAFMQYKGRAKIYPPTKSHDADRAVILPVVDHHLGMFSWSKETGDDYDLKIARQLLLDVSGQLLSASQPAGTCVILNLGDFVHGDDSTNTTAKSGNVLDVDTRYGKVLKYGVELLIEIIDLALLRHDKVVVRNIPGNHDMHTALMLSIALDLFYREHPRVTVDTDPGDFFKWRFGKCLIAANHGHRLKPANMALYMAAQWPEDWGETEYRYFYWGHVHHRDLKEVPGVITESFQTLAPKDAWHAQGGYLSGRSMCAITLHKDKGEISRVTHSIS
jgi:hypothetical protein